MYYPIIISKPVVKAFKLHIINIDMRLSKRSINTRLNTGIDTYN